MTTLKWLASVSLAIATLPAIHAEPHCPGNDNSLRPCLVQRSLIVVLVEINHSGPYDLWWIRVPRLRLSILRFASALHEHSTLAFAGFSPKRRNGFGR
jgi:hypothetical protein